MKKISVNEIIRLSTSSIVFLLVLLSILTTVNFLWWTVKPSEGNVLNNVPSQGVNDKVMQSIINNAPFGIVQKKAESVAPVVMDDIKVVGVYAGGADNSIAFLLVNNQSQIAKIGDKVLSDTVKNILPNGIVLSNANGAKTIEISSGNATPNQNIPNNAQNMNQRNEPHNPPMENRNNEQNMNQNLNNNQQPPASQSNHGGMEDVVAQRKKMIEQFQQQNN